MRNCTGWTATNSFIDWHCYQHLATVVISKWKVDGRTLCYGSASNLCTFFIHEIWQVPASTFSLRTLQEFLWLEDGTMLILSSRLVLVFVFVIMKFVKWCGIWRSVHMFVVRMPFFLLNLTYIFRSMWNGAYFCHKKNTSVGEEEIAVFWKRPVFGKMEKLNAVFR